MDTLQVVPFDASMSEAVANFNCGDEPWQSELATWIVNDALEAIKRGTKVWLYLDSAGEVVGYGSLGTTNWKYPDPDSKRTVVAIIPNVAIHRQFQGQPADAPREARYSSQILRHLILEAESLSGPPPALGLYVHPENKAAIKLYERFHFQPSFHQYRDSATGITYLGYVRRLGVNSD
jgi:ribosomal protein S18 acetylase RimI-like enzyme